MKLSPSVCSIDAASLNMLLSTNIGTEPYSLQSLTARLSTPLLYQCSRVLLLKPQVRAQRAFGFEIPRDSNSRICFIGRRYKYSEFPLMSKNRFFSPLFFSQWEFSGFLTRILFWYDNSGQQSFLLYCCLLHYTIVSCVLDIGIYSKTAVVCVLRIPL